MKGLLSYSGIATKIRAMEGKLISQRQLKTMAALESVPDAVSYLKTLPAYESTFAGLDDESLHRGIIERLLTDSLYRDYTSLYRFASLRQRKFLDFYFQHFEISILKNCLRNALAHQPASLGLAKHEEFFKKHSKIDIVRLSASLSLDEFIANLEGSPYYSLLSKLRESDDTNPFDYEMAMDLYHFVHTFDYIRKKLPKGERETILKCYGANLDLLNLQWIYRMKKYYQIPPDQIRSLLIPIHLHLKPDEISRLISAEKLEDFFNELERTRYGPRIQEAGLSEQPDLEAFTRILLKRIYKQAGKTHPYSLAVLSAYLYFKEAEQNKIITILESIRYRVDANDILAYIDQN